MASFCVLAVAFTVFSTLKASLLPDDRYFNEEDPCDDFSYDGRRLPFAEVLLGKRMFDSRNCGVVVPIGDVNTEIPIVRFSEVRTLAGIMAVYDCLKSSARSLFSHYKNTHNIVQQVGWVREAENRLSSFAIPHSIHSISRWSK